MMAGSIDDCTCGARTSRRIDHYLHCAYRKGEDAPTSAPTGGAEPDADPMHLAQVKAAHSEAMAQATRCRQLADDDSNAFRVNVALEQAASALEVIAGEALRLGCAAEGHVCHGSQCACGENHL